MLHHENIRRHRLQLPGSRAPLAALACALALGAGCVVADESERAGWYDDQESLGEIAEEVVYGTDDRMDVFAHPDATLRARAQQSTVALMSPSAINTSNPGAVTFNSPTLQEDLNLCSSERFLNDPTAAFCSGTLIDDDLVLTAGHCITKARDCLNTRFVFNYYRTSDTTLQTVTTADIFSCTSIVARQQSSTKGKVLDYAIVRIDRSATPRFTPAPVRKGLVPLSLGQNVAVIGSGSGMPFKIDAGGTLRDPRSGIVDFFEATTDTFAGNSGSGVYETGTYNLAGILVRGETDYRSNGTCNVVNTCSETDCSGEDSTYVGPALDHFCSLATSGRLCGP
jgi:hypothetical protein